jgi:aspartyl-tRNA(Asn)/glutamyl-tRNA(Gln) amidotransferase subunit A
MGRTLDHAGPMARTPADAALMHAATVEGLRGAPIARELAARTSSSVAGLRMGTCPDLALIPPTPAVQGALANVVASLGELGCSVHEVGFPDAVAVIGVFVPIRDAETLYSHRVAGLFPDRRSEYSELTFARLSVAESVGLDEYLAAGRERWRLGEAFAALFDQVDVLVLPTMAAPPPRIDHAEPDVTAWELVGLHMVPENLLGLPACAIRAGFDEDGLPIGVQIVGREGADATVLAVAQALYDATPDVQRRLPQL